MTRYIRHAAAFCTLLLLALLVNASRVQILRAQSYDTNPANRRTTIARYHQPRGDILVDGRPVTGSRDTGEQLRYERTYTDGLLYAPVTGFASQVYGTTLLEHTEDAVLSGTDPMLTPATSAMRFVVTASDPSRFRILMTASSTASTVCRARRCCGFRRAAVRAVSFCDAVRMKLM